MKIYVLRQKIIFAVWLLAVCFINYSLHGAMRQSAHNDDYDPAGALSATSDRRAQVSKNLVLLVVGNAWELDCDDSDALDDSKAARKKALDQLCRDLVQKPYLINCQDIKINRCEVVYQAPCNGQSFEQFSQELESLIDNKISSGCIVVTYTCNSDANLVNGLNKDGVMKKISAMIQMNPRTDQIQPNLNQIDYLYNFYSKTNISTAARASYEVGKRFSSVSSSLSDLAEKVVTGCTGAAQSSAQYVAPVVAATVVGGSQYTPHIIVGMHVVNVVAQGCRNTVEGIQNIFASSAQVIGNQFRRLGQRLCGQASAAQNQSATAPAQLMVVPLPAEQIKPQQRYIQKITNGGHFPVRNIRCVRLAEDSQKHEDALIEVDPDDKLMYSAKMIRSLPKFITMAYSYNVNFELKLDLYNPSIQAVSQDRCLESNASNALTTTDSARELSIVNADDDADSDGLVSCVSFVPLGQQDTTDNFHCVVPYDNVCFNGLMYIYHPVIYGNGKYQLKHTDDSESYDLMQINCPNLGQDYSDQEFIFINKLAIDMLLSNCILDVVIKLRCRLVTRDDSFQGKVNRFSETFASTPFGIIISQHKHSLLSPIDRLGNTPMHWCGQVFSNLSCDRFIDMFSVYMINAKSTSTQKIMNFSNETILQAFVDYFTITCQNLDDNQINSSVVSARGASEKILNYLLCLQSSHLLYSQDDIPAVTQKITAILQQFLSQDDQSDSDDSDE